MEAYFMIDHPLDNILRRSRHAVLWSLVWSACAALLIWLPFSFVVNANYEVHYAAFLFTFTGGIWLILLGIHLLIRFFAERFKKTQDARTTSRLKRAARLVLLLPWGSFLFFFIAVFVALIYWHGGDVSRLLTDTDGWAFTLMFFFTALIHLAMLVLVYGACYSTLRLYFLLRKEPAQKRFMAGIPSGCVDAIALGLLVPGIGFLSYYALQFYDSRHVVLTQPRFHALAFLDQQSILSVTFDDKLAIFDTSTREPVVLVPKIITERRGSTINGRLVNFFVRPRLVDENRAAVALLDDGLTLTRIALMPDAESRNIVYEERLTLFDVDPAGEWCLAMHETGRISLTRFPVAENEEPTIQWIDAPLARVEHHKKIGDYFRAYSTPFDFVFLLPRKNDPEQPDIALVLKEGIYTVRTAPDYRETFRTDLSFPGDNENTNSRIFVSPNSQYVILSFGRRGRLPQHKSVLLDCATGKLLIDLPPLFETNYASVLAFSPDSRMLLSISLDPHRDGNAKVRVWSISETEMKGRPISVSRFVRNVQFSPDGRFVASPVGGKIHFWSFPQWKRRYSLPLSRMGDDALIGFSPDGSLVFANQYEGFSVLKTTLDP